MYRWTTLVLGAFTKAWQNPGLHVKSSRAYLAWKMTRNKKPLRFVDVFAGCGGLSLGLLEAGCKGLFAIEKSPLAFETLKHNLVDGSARTFDWPIWLPKKAMTCEELLAKYSDEIGKIAGKVDLIVGGPPCQGFSTAGKRDPADPRNKMTEQYLSLVGLLRPRFIVIENVSGFDMKFENELGIELLMEGEKSGSYAAYISRRLCKSGYNVSYGILNCADFGVPQNRHRFIMICELQTTELSDSNDGSKSNLFSQLIKSSLHFRKRRGLAVDLPVSVHQAISDLAIGGRELTPCTDSLVSGFKEAIYISPENPSPFQKLMRKGVNGAPDSRRLPNHKAATKQYFDKVQKICIPGASLSVDQRKKLGTRKHSTSVLGANLPSPTITTLPDDILHYNEPRILTVRENARLQTFPDWFSFRGKYTTGGKQRKFECPRYTQVGNAVPPLLAEAIGELLMKTNNLAKKKRRAIRGPTKLPRTRSSNVIRIRS